MGFIEGLKQPITTWSAQAVGATGMLTAYASGLFTFQEAMLAIIAVSTFATGAQLHLQETRLQEAIEGE